MQATLLKARHRAVARKLSNERDGLALDDAAADAYAAACVSCPCCGEQAGHGTEERLIGLEPCRAIEWERGVDFEAVRAARAKFWGEALIIGGLYLAGPDYSYQLNLEAIR